MKDNRDITASFDLPKDHSSIIKVIGVGGGGSNAVNHMYKQGIKGVDFIICNTDQQSLDASPVPIKVQLGSELTEGRGAGSIPDVGREAAKENLDEIRDILKSKTKMVFITAGMGGGTGTGAAPVIASVAREMGILTVGIVTIPFAFEGKRRAQQASAGLDELRKNVDTLLVISNDKLRDLAGNLTVTAAFGQADNVLTIAAKGIAEIITVTGYINVDFADVYTVMKDGGSAIMGSAHYEGENRALSAVELALSSPLLNDNRIKGANHVLINITSGNEEVRMDEIGSIIDYVQEEAGQTANVIFGTGFDATLENRISVTVIATGFESAPEDKSTVVHNLDTTKKPAETVKPKMPEPILNTYKEDQVVNRPITVAPDKEELKMLGKKENENQEDLTMTLTVRSEEEIQHKEQERKEEIHKQAEERMQRVKELANKLPNTPSAPLHATELENIPAYLRRNYKLQPVSNSNESQLSRYTLTDNPETNTRDIRPNNNFLHDNVD